MAETFDIKIRTVADTSGLKAVQAGVVELSGEMRSALGADMATQLEAKLGEVIERVPAELREAFIQGISSGARDEMERLLQSDPAEQQAASLRDQQNEMELRAMMLARKDAEKAEQAALIAREKAAEMERRSWARQRTEEERMFKQQVQAQEKAAQAVRIAAEREVERIAREALAAEKARAREAERRISEEMAAAKATASRIGGVIPGVGGAAGAAFGGGPAAGVAGAAAAVIGVQQLIGTLTAYGDAVNKAMAESGGLTLELAKQVEQWQKLAQGAGSVEDVEALQRKSADTVEQLRQKFRGMNEEGEHWIEKLAKFGRDMGPFPKLFQGFQSSAEMAQEAVRDQIGQMEIFAASDKRIAEASVQRTMEEEAEAQLRRDAAHLEAKQEQERAEANQRGIDEMNRQRAESVQTMKDEAKWAAELEAEERERGEALDANMAAMADLYRHIEKQKPNAEKLANDAEREANARERAAAAAREAQNALEDNEGDFSGVDAPGRAGRAARGRARSRFTREQQQRAADAAAAGVPATEIARITRENEDRFNEGMRMARGRVGGGAGQSERNGTGGTGPSADFQRQFGGAAQKQEAAAASGQQAAQSLVASAAAQEAANAAVIAMADAMVAKLNAHQTAIDFLKSKIKG